MKTASATLIPSEAFPITRCPGCLDHAIPPPASAGEPDTRRFEISLEAAVLHGVDPCHHIVKIMSRVPRSQSGPFPPLPSGSAAEVVAVVDLLERGTFDAEESADIADELREHFPGATVHVSPLGPDLGGRTADDAWRDGDLLCRIFEDGSTPMDRPGDFWREVSARTAREDRDAGERWRAVLYVDPESPRLVRHGWPKVLAAWNGDDSPLDMGAPTDGPGLSTEREAPG